MSCSVSIGGDCDGNAEFQNVQTCRARKAYKCYECRDVIAAGGRYQRKRRQPTDRPSQGVARSATMRLRVAGSTPPDTRPATVPSASTNTQYG